MATGPQLSIVNFARDAYLTVEGKQNADHFYIVRAGTVRISSEVPLANEADGGPLNPGDFFGVVATMSSHSHVETAKAMSDVSLIAVHRDQYGLLIQRNTPVAIKIIQEFSRRMRYLDAALTRVSFKSTADESPAHLFTVAEYYARQNQFNQAFYAYYKYLQYCSDGEHAQLAKERLTKIKPYAKAVHLNNAESQESMGRTYPKNTMIFSESEPGGEMFIIQKGRVKISKIVDDQEILIALLKPGEFFGEMALLENKPRSASAIAHDDEVTVLVVNKTNFERMVQTQAQLITRLTTTLAERIWTVQRTLVNAAVGDPLGRLYDQLFLQLEKNRIATDATAPYTFDFGPKELINMVGFSSSEGNVHVQKLLENSKMKLLDNRIHTTDVQEIVKQTEYFKRMENINKARAQGSLKAN
jgi:CRP-like cAMP-binding protein